MPYKDKQKQKEAQRRHYYANKSRYRESTRNRRKRNKEYVYSMKTECVHCGLEDKDCLEFHHLSDKSKSVAQLIRDATSICKLKLEV